MAQTFLPQQTPGNTPMPTVNSPNGGGQGENQYGTYPTMPNMTTPGSVPMPGATPQSTAPNSFPNTPGPGGPYSQVPGNHWYDLGSGQYEVPAQDPALQNSLFNYLQSQVGTGITPYNLQAMLPTGGATQPGQVASPLDPVTQQLMQFFQTGQSSNSALNSLQSLATTGNPVDQTPAWQAMVAAAQQQIDKGGANVREQYAFNGNLPGSAGANAIGDYYSNANLGLTSQLVNAQTQAQQQAVQNQLAASSELGGMQQSLGSTLYGYDQKYINSLMQEYFQTTPQENPLNQEIFSGATTYAPTYGKTSSGGFMGSLLNAAGVATGIAGKSLLGL